jgi:hypothetical protein
MANTGKGGGKTHPPAPQPEQDTPKTFPQVVPQDLYPTSDIRFVMMEIGKLTANVDRLIQDVKGQGDKIDTLRQQASYIKGGIAVAVLLIGGFIWIASSFLDHKWDAAINSLAAFAKQQPMQPTPPVSSAPISVATPPVR